MCPVCQSFHVPQQASLYTSQTRHGPHTDTELVDTLLQEGEDWCVCSHVLRCVVDWGSRMGQLCPSKRVRTCFFLRRWGKKSKSHGTKMVQVSCCCVHLLLFSSQSQILWALFNIIKSFLLLMLFSFVWYYIPLRVLQGWQVNKPLLILGKLGGWLWSCSGKEGAGEGVG